MQGQIPEMFVDLKQRREDKLFSEEKTFTLDEVVYLY